MPDGDKTKKLPPIQIPTEAFVAFSYMAKRESKTFSQAVRDAMHEYCANRGAEVNFNIGTWGGDRRTSQDDS